MYHTDIAAAVEAGVIDAEAALRLRNFDAARHAAPLADDEHFGLVGGLADVMTSAGLALLLGALGVAAIFAGPVGAAMLMAGSWALAEYFTARRRMTLTSFVLFGVFVIAACCGLLGLAMRVLGSGSLDVTAAGAITTTPLGGIFIAAGTTMACALYWWRFRLPFAYMAAAVAAVNLGVHLVHLLLPAAPSLFVSLLLLATGIVLFAVAMWWDMSDVRRETRRSDVAFWLHWAAGYQISHAAFRLLLGVKGDPAGWDRLYAYAPADGAGLAGVLVLFGVFAVVALAVDRRSLLLSSLVFVLPSLAAAVSDVPPVALFGTAILSGGFLVLTAGFWRQARMIVLPLLPALLRAQLPRTDLTFARARPVA